MNSVDKGAHFYKTDLQIHSPRDVNWKGNKPTEPEARLALAARMVQACRERAIGAIAITDHHDFVFCGVIRQAAAMETGSDGGQLAASDRLVVLPGLELTLAVPCQALLLLDANFPEDRFDSILVALKIESTDPSLPSHASPKQLPFQDLAALYDHLDQHSWLKGHYIILPNVTDGGYGTLMRSGMQDKYSNMPCVGGYIDAGAKIGKGNETIFAGLNKEYGNKRLALIYTSDARTETFADLGKHPTWIKWAEPTAEALRQACLANESRIAIAYPQLPDARLTRLSVSNSQYMGPIEVELNPQFSALIGGRGTGKSTILEYLRWALCDQPPPPGEGDELSDLMGRRKALIQSTLEPLGAHVDVHFVINGIEHTVRRRAHPDELRLRVGSDEFKPVSEEDIRRLLPIQAYSQRQLSTVGVRLDEVTRFVIGPIRSALDDIKSREEAVVSQLRENFVALQRWRELQRLERRDELQLASLTQQAETLRKELATTSPEDKALIEEKPRIDKAQDVVTALIQRLSSVQSDLAESKARTGRLSSELPTFPDATLRGNDSLTALESAVIDAFSRVNEGLAKLNTDLDRASASGSALRVAEKKWIDIYRDFGAGYQAATTRAAVHVSQIKTLEDIEKQRTDIAEQIATRRSELAKIGRPVDTKEQLRKEWVKVQHERTAAISAQCGLLLKLSDELLRARLEARVEVEGISGRFRAALSGSGIRGAKVDDFVGAIVDSKDPLDAWLSAIDELATRVLARDDAEAPAPTSTSTALRTFSQPDMDKMVAKLAPNTLLELELVPLDDRPVFEYATKPGEFIPFRKASPGQQATALLRVLLAQPGPPLVIDQPEDDLDSQVVLQVAERIWSAKTQRQLIFASHNANLVVNGDAELVICCDYRAAADESGGQIKLEGAIDVPVVREEITKVMEGGEKAFRMRQQKYGF
jgi:chromosome segregation protein